jgi:hypothetical protein
VLRVSTHWQSNGTVVSVSVENMSRNKCFFSGSNITCFTFYIQLLPVYWHFLVYASCILSYCSCFEKENKSRLMQSPCCLCIHVSPHQLWMVELICMKLGMCIMAPEPISTTHFINPSHQSVCIYVYPPIVARQRLGKNGTAPTDTQATLEELLNASFSMQSVSHQRKVGD